MSEKINTSITIRYYTSKLELKNLRNPRNVKTSITAAIMMSAILLYQAHDIHFIEKNQKEKKYMKLKA